MENLAKGLENQEDLTVRHILVDWLMEYRLGEMTLHRAIGLLDRYIAATETQIRRTCYQLVGLACMVIACKFEEVISPSISYICDATYNEQEIIKMESHILRDVEWEICQPTSREWLEWWLFVVCEHSDIILKSLCRALLDTTLLNHEVPSRLARAALNAGQMITGDREESEADSKSLTLKLIQWGNWCRRFGKLHWAAG
jgi:hypothetical protein